MKKLLFLAHLSFFLGTSAITAFTQNSHSSSGSDFKISGYDVHVTIGETFASFSVPNSFVQEGVLAVLIENFILTEQNLEPEVQIFPNPFLDFIEIKIKSTNWSLMDVEIYSLSGELIQSFHMPNSVVKVPLGTLKNGTYFIRFHGFGLPVIVRKLYKI